MMRALNYPSCIIQDAAYLLKGNAKLQGNGPLRDVSFFIKRPDQIHVFLGKLVSGVSFSCRTMGPALLRLIFIVLGYRTKEKMGWVHAGSHVASVTNTETFGNGANMHLVGGAMARHNLAIVRNTISTAIFRPQPKPARTGFVDLIKKALFKGGLPFRHLCFIAYEVT